MTLERSRRSVTAAEAGREAGSPVDDYAGCGLSYRKYGLGQIWTQMADGQNIKTGPAQVPVQIAWVTVLVPMSGGGGGTGRLLGSKVRGMSSHALPTRSGDQRGTLPKPY